MTVLNSLFDDEMFREILDQKNGLIASPKKWSGNVFKKGGRGRCHYYKAIGAPLANPFFTTPISGDARLTKKTFWGDISIDPVSFKMPSAYKKQNVLTLTHCLPGATLLSLSGLADAAGQSRRQGTSVPQFGRDVRIQVLANGGWKWV